MPKRYDSMLTKPMPSTRMPLLAVLLLLAAIVVVWLVFLRPPHKLLGERIPKNEYQHFMQTPKKPKAQPQPAPPAATPAPPAPTTP